MPTGVARTLAENVAGELRATLPANARMAGKMKKLVLALCILFLAMTLFGQSKGKGKGQSAKTSGKAGTAVSASAVFSRSDRRVIQEWAKGIRPNELPPGLAKRGELPPGLQKQLQKRGTLPPGLERKISPFPDDLTRRLAPLPAGCGCDRIFLEGKALIVARATLAVLDVISLF